MSIRLRILTNRISLRVITAVILCGILSGCSQAQEPKYEKKTETVSVKTVEKKTPAEKIQDNKELYNKDNDLITMYLTIVPGDKDTDTVHTWEEINKYSADNYEDMGVDRYKVKGILEIKKNGEKIYTADVPNVTVNIRGQSSTKSKKKSYKIKINDDCDMFNGSRTINLNKHFSDPYRFINKLSYDLLNEVPQLIGGQTDFVNLYVKDLTSSDKTGYTDYGLYTMVEQVNKSYLKKRNLDENGYLYKASIFEWAENDALMATEENFVTEDFEYFLEIKGEKDPKKLQEMIARVNNYSISIEDIVNENFDEDNIIYWMAFNILIGNYDGASRNFYLYSPLNSDKFYLICWDIDAAFRRHFYEYIDKNMGSSWERGVSRYLGVKLINRMMKEEKYRDALIAAVEDLHSTCLSKENIDAHVEQYKKTTKKIIYKGVDYEDAPIDDIRVYDSLTDSLGEEVEENYEYFFESMKKPFPFFILAPSIEGKKIKFSWDVAYNYGDGNIKYDCKISDDPAFKNVLYKANDLTIPTFSIKKLPPGEYYIKVVAKNDQGYSIDCFNYYIENGNKNYGCYHFTVGENNIL